MTASALGPEYNFHENSLADVVEARDLYHFHLLNKSNVVGTAIGLYLVRKSDPWPKSKVQKARHATADPARPRPKRTLANSEVRGYSWPCVIVLVRKWEDPAAFASDASGMVPKTLYMPDGRAVPVCIVEAGTRDAHRDPPMMPPPPSHTLGGGLAISVETQQVEYAATVGGLVSDGHYVYALTAGHVCGDKGTAVTSRLRGGAVRVGESAGKTLTRLPFSEVYPAFPGQRSYSMLDVGLVQVDDARRWTSNTFGLPPLGQMADFHERNLSFRLIDQPVIGYGAASGLLQGTIKALFYRYRSVGGYDYVGDYLISPVGETATRHGDSGMVWHLDVTEDPEDGPRVEMKSRTLLPLAVEWGGQVFEFDGAAATFAVATSLSSVCKLLDVELVSDLDRDVSGYWGRTGHYSVAAFAVQVVKDPKLKEFLANNLDRLSYPIGEIEDENFDERVGDASEAGLFVPLADVPDEIWKHVPIEKNAQYGRRGGRDTHGGQRSDGPEHPNHYADIDEAPSGKVSWRDQCVADPALIDPDIWRHDFYEKMAEKAKKAGDSARAGRLNNEGEQGLLPFRVWQLYDAMVDCLAAGDLVGFLTAAGVCAHYVGDASQPLHGSVFADGDPSRTVKRWRPRKKVWETVIFGKGVHGDYETDMVSAKVKPIIEGIAAKLPKKHGLRVRTDGRGCAHAVLELMQKVAELLPPAKILTGYEAALAKGQKAPPRMKGSVVTDSLWEELGDGTIAVMTEGAKTLALVWDSAWKAGGGGKLDEAALAAIDTELLIERYIDPDFVPSKQLDQIGALLKP